MSARSAGPAIGRGEMFADAQAIARARAEMLSDRAHPPLAMLRRSTELFLKLPPERAPRITSSANLFVIQNCLLELSLIACLGEEDRHVDGLSDLIVALDASAISTERLPEELHWSFVVIGLAVALDLAGHLLAEDSLAAGRAAIQALAERLHAESLTQEWGEPLKRRAAWNHSIVSFSGIGAAGLALPEHPLAPEWVTLAGERALLFFEHGITAAGMTREGLAYCGFVFRNLGLFLRGSRAIGAFDYLDPAQNPFLERLGRVPEWFAGEIFPHGGWLQNLNDSYWDPSPALVGWLATFPALRPELAAAVWHRTLGEAGRATYGLDPKLAKSSVFESALWYPEAPVKADDGTSFYHCPDVGYVRDWSRDSQTGFSFNCGEYIGAIHDQSDNNAFTLFGYGVPIALDAGACNYPEEGNASSSFGHNAVVVDGRGQLPAGHGYGASGEIVYLDRDESRLIVAGDARRSFISLDYNPVRRAVRWCVFVKQPEPYLLVYDDVQKDEAEHDYEFLLHTPTPNMARIDQGVVRMNIDFEGHRATCDVAALEPETIAIRREPFACPGHPPFEQHALWRLARRAVNPEFIVLLLPGPQTGPPAYRAEVERAARSLTITIRFASGHVDRVVLPRGGITGPTPPGFRRERTPWRRSTARAVERSGVQRAAVRHARAMRAIGFGRRAWRRASGPTGVAESAGPTVRPSATDAPAATSGDAPTQAVPTPAATSRDAPTPAVPTPPGGSPADLRPADDLALGRLRRLQGLTAAVETLSGDPDYPTPPERGVVMGHADFRRIGRDFLDHFVAFADLHPDADVLDAGCGGGRMAACLLYYLRDGSYTGFDVHVESIDWCRQAIAPRNPRFRFDDVALHNSLYNPVAQADAADYRFRYEDQRFDFVIATSLFTHMFRDEAANYLREFARVLRPGGVAFVTAYLLNADSVTAMSREAGAVRFPDAFRDSQVMSHDRPAAGVAHHQDWLLADARACGLGLDRVAYGAWTTQTRLSKQDILLFRRDR